MTTWEPGETVLVTGALGGQLQRAVLIGPDPDDAARFLVRYTSANFGRPGVQSVHGGRMRKAPVDDGSLPSWLAS